MSVIPSQLWASPDSPPSALLTTGVWDLDVSGGIRMVLFSFWRCFVDEAPGSKLAVMDSVVFVIICFCRIKQFNQVWEKGSRLGLDEKRKESTLRCHLSVHGRPCVAVFKQGLSDGITYKVEIELLMKR